PIETITSKNSIITHNGKNIDKCDVFHFLQTRLDRYSFRDHLDIPFTGGLAGYWGYDLGRELEIIPENTIDDINVPDMMVGIYTNVLAHDHKSNKTWLVGDKPCFPTTKKLPYNSADLKWNTQTSDEDYKGKIQKIIDYIYAGEIYQVNLSRRFEADLPKEFNRFEHYKKLRKINSAPFSAYMNFGEVHISSSSPERFLKCAKSFVETQPIKGTLPSSCPAEFLKNSQKDIAENTMIVDLLRNDLSKVCDYHSVKVPKLCELQTFEGLHHLVSTVTGTLQKGKTALDLLKACFPGGSITGAPKIRAMEIIEELEETRRGPYCGAMGYINFNGNMDTNIIIRTLIYTQNKAYLQTGSGIVSDSKPAQELQESLDKAQKIFESFDTKRKESAA
ncbi:MAG TPA: anthranilate synthase component I family protein, partial [Alphaproteobacteria bacterium]|nr:anthranilate synthase component I family protein [Alphaproteobacteria bacterium]